MGVRGRDSNRTNARPVPGTMPALLVLRRIGIDHRRSGRCMGSSPARPAANLVTCRASRQLALFHLALLIPSHRQSAPIRMSLPVFGLGQGLALAAYPFPKAARLSAPGPYDLCILLIERVPRRALRSPIGSNRAPPVVFTFETHGDTLDIAS